MLPQITPIKLLELAEHRSILVCWKKRAFLVFVSNHEEHLRHLNNLARWTTIADLPRLVLEGYACQAPSSVPAIANATSTKPAWVDHANRCTPQILLLVATGAMWTLNALFTKSVPIIIVSDVSLENASIGVR